MIYKLTDTYPKDVMAPFAFIKSSPFTLPSELCRKKNILSWSQFPWCGRDLSGTGDDFNLKTSDASLGVFDKLTLIHTECPAQLVKYTKWGAWSAKSWLDL